MTSSQPTAPAATRQVISAENLYQPDRFKVILGTGTVAFCTVWNEPKAILTRQPALLAKAAIIGTLYSSQGVNIIIRNLALNPFITKLYLWGHGTLSNTKFGQGGTHVLRQLWQAGVGQDGTVPGTSFKLEPEIDPSVVNVIREQVKLVDVSHLELEVAISEIDDTAAANYMESVRFPDAVLKAPSTFPSEKIGWSIRGRTVLTAWEQVVERIMRYGTVKSTQYGDQQKELLSVTWVITDEDPTQPQLPEDLPLSLRETIGATSEAIDQYKSVFLSPDKPPGVEYTYGNRLMSYPAPAGKLDQIEQAVIGHLKKSLDSRRAVAITLVPWLDHAANDQPPCVTQVQALHSEGKLHFLVTVRSHDIFKAGIPNAFGLRLLQQKICTELKVTMGSLCLTSHSAHIYEQDWDNANKLAACRFWERPPQKMYDATQADPRGVFLIRVTPPKLQVDFNTLDGQPLLQFEGVSADRLALEISKAELISQTGHALDIGIQLARAEIAAKQGIEFVQDRPLVL
jgi:thymidylate synthase